MGGSLPGGELEKAVKSLYLSSRVLVVTGFCIKEVMIGETDGPVGAVSLANALLQLGKGLLRLKLGV